MATPVRSANCSASGTGSDADPLTQSRRRPSAETPAVPTNRWYMVGTPKNSDARWSDAASSTEVASKRGRRTADAPAASVPSNPTHRPWTWHNGRAWTSRSSGSHRQAAWSERAPATTLAWDSTAPLGTPVVPEVNTISAGSPGAAVSSAAGPSPPAGWAPPGQGSRSGESVAVGVPVTHRACSGRSTTATAGRTSVTTCCSSRSVPTGLTGTSTAPRRSPASAATTPATVGPLLHTIRSPAPSPNEASRAAAAAERASSSPAAHQPPGAPASKRVGRAGSADHRWASTEGTVTPGPPRATDPTPGGRWRDHGSAVTLRMLPSRPRPDGARRHAVTWPPMSPRRVAVVPHTHWDREWYEPYQTFRMNLVEMLDGLLALLEEDPSYRRFLLDGQMAVVDDYLEIRPEGGQRLAELAASGRLTMGPWYILMDEFLVSGETIVRNLQMGIKRGAAFNGVMEVGYLPDMFGHVAQMPQLLAEAGFHHAVVWRGVPSQITSTGFTWEALDGSTVRAEYLPVGYSNGASLPDDAKALVRRVADHEAEVAEFLIGGLLIMNGSDHLVPQPFLGRVVAEANALQ